MKKDGWLLILACVCWLLTGLAWGYGYGVKDKAIHCPDCTCFAMRVVTAPDGSLVDLSDCYLTGNGIGIFIKDSPVLTPSPTRTPMPTRQVSAEVKVTASVCENGRIIYPARMEVKYAGVVELDLVNELSGPMDGYYQVCPTGHRNHTQCWDVPAVNVELIRVDCATPTPVPEVQNDQCTDPNGLCIGSRWLITFADDTMHVATLVEIGTANGKTYYQSSVSGPKTREEFLETFTLWEMKE